LGILQLISFSLLVKKYSFIFSYYHLSTRH